MLKRLFDEKLSFKIKLRKIHTRNHVQFHYLKYIKNQKLPNAHWQDDINYGIYLLNIEHYWIWYSNKNE